MEFIRDTNWEEVFEGWGQREENNPAWIECATVVKGWPDWKSWRRSMASQMDLPNLKWKLHRFTNPMEEIPKMLVGNHQGWQFQIKDETQRNKLTFNDFLKDPKRYEFISKHSKILDIMANFPSPTQFVGLIREDIDECLCYEGNHRASAVALARYLGRSIDFGSPPEIALAQFSIDRIHLIDEALKRGSNKNPTV